MYELVTDATVLPLSLAEAKNHCKVETDATADDAWIMGAIRSAVQRCQDETRLSLMTQTWRLYLDRFPGGREEWWDGVRQGSLSELVGHRRYIEIGKSPIQSVTHLKTYDDSDNASAMSASDYQVDTVSRPGRLVLRNGKTWPATVLRPVNGIEIEFVAGYGSNMSSVPQSLRQAMLNDILHMYEHRGDGIGDEGQMLTQTPVSPQALNVYNRYKVRSL